MEREQFSRHGRQRDHSDQMIDVSARTPETQVDQLFAICDLRHAEALSSHSNASGSLRTAQQTTRSLATTTTELFQLAR